MSHAAESPIIAGVSWGSSHFRAYRIGAEGVLTDSYNEGAGIATLDRGGMAEAVARLVARWPGLTAIYASGMIGSPLGWTDVPYTLAPVGHDALARAAVVTVIGPAPVRIIPGIACVRASDGAPDVLRGEEVELVGLAADRHDNGLMVLPGAHSKWVSLTNGRVTDFVTSMTGEIFDRLTTQGLLASIAGDEARDGAAFREGVAIGRDASLGLGALLFGARARVMRGLIAKQDAASYLRGVLIGSELSDAERLFAPLFDAVVTLVGQGPLAALYAAALGSAGARTQFADASAACVAGFGAIHRATRFTPGD